MKGFLCVLILLLMSAVAVAKDEVPAVALSGAPAKTEGPENKWGLGLGFGVEQFHKEYLDSASLQGDARIVTLEKSYKTKPSVWLTGTWNIWALSPWTNTADGTLIRQTSIGLFVGVKLLDTNGDSLSALSLGPQVNFSLPKGRSLSVGIGWVTHRTKTFARGISDGQPLPVEYDNIVYREGTENSYMLMVSYGL